MKLHFLGAAHEVTGSCTLLETDKHRILIDCGMEQGADTYQNDGVPAVAGDIDCILLTHAHIDHAGRIPLLVKRGFAGPVYTTEATKALCKIMLLDSAHIQEFEAEWRSRKAKRSGGEAFEPLYTTDDASRALTLFKGCGYGKPMDIFDDVTVTFTDAGHLLGSASITVTVREAGKEPHTLLLSGDLGNVRRPLIRDPQTPPAADTVIIESTYGDRLHGDHRPDYAVHLSHVLQRTFDRGGNVVIPSFAVGRTQELLYLLRQIKEDHMVTGHDGFPVWVDSPLAVEATNIYGSDLEDYFDEETLALRAKGENPILFPDLHVAVTSDESKRINADKTPKVILSASGMCEAGRIRHHLKHNLWRPECAVLFVGYQSIGTVGRKIIDGATSVKLFGEDIQVRAAVETLEGISGHADMGMLLGWLRALPEKPARVFVNHGDDEVVDGFAARITEEIGVPAAAPYPDSVYTVEDGACLAPGNRVKIERTDRGAAPQSTPGSRAAQSVFLRLQAAGERLIAVIRRNKGGANKDLAKFADQINALADKWDR